MVRLCQAALATTCSHLSLYVRSDHGNTMCSKTNCKLTVGRVKLMRNKKNLQVTLRNRLSLYAEAKKHGAEIADAPKSKTDGVPGSVWASVSYVCAFSTVRLN